MRRVETRAGTGRIAAVAILVLTVSHVACRDSGITDPPDDVGSALIVSNPIARMPAASLAARASLAPAAASRVFVSLPPGTAPLGVEASITNLRDGTKASAAVLDGGFDPIAIEAGAGDMLELRVLDALGGSLLVSRAGVERSRRPTVVRTSPPKGKRDVPLYSIAVVVFSEPIDETTLNDMSVHLTRGGERVPGWLVFRDRDQTAVAFIPDDPLQPSTDYRLVITTGIRDLDGESLELEETVEFSTEPVPEEVEPSPDVASILVDASRDGGVWWYPQWAGEGNFDPGLWHQGMVAADSLRARGYAVTELPRPYTITSELLAAHDIVIRAVGFGTYTSSEIAAYREYVERGGQLLLLADHMRHLPADQLAESFGIRFGGVTQGENLLDSLATHPLTRGVDALWYGVGSAVLAHPPSATILGWLSEGSWVDLDFDSVQQPGEPSAPAAFGVMTVGAGRIVFMGDANLLNGVPQPFLDNLLAYFTSP